LLNCGRMRGRVCLGGEKKREAGRTKSEEATSPAGWPKKGGGEKIQPHNTSSIRTTPHYEKTVVIP